MRLVLLGMVGGCFVKPAPPTALCQNLGDWGAPQLNIFANVNRSDADDWGAYLSPDKLELVFASGRDNMTAVYHALRQHPQDVFDAPTQLPLDPLSAVDADPFLSDDAKRIWYGINGDIDIVTSSRTDRMSPFAKATTLQNVQSTDTDGDHDA